MGDRACTESGPPKTVLVVDDHDLVRKMVVSTLVKEGFSVVSAANGAQAIGEVRTNSSVSCMLQDLSMPTMSGEQIIAEVAALRPDLGVLVYSAHEESEVAHRLSPLGVAGYLQKPFDPDVLFAKIRAILSA